MRIKCLKILTILNKTIITNRIRFLLVIYVVPKKNCFTDRYRYLSLLKNTLNYKRVQLSCLPPTFAFAYQHLYCVFHQIQVWIGNELNSQDHGWKLIDDSLELIQILIPPACQIILFTCMYQLSSQVLLQSWIKYDK